MQIKPSFCTLELYAGIYLNCFSIKLEEKNHNFRTKNLASTTCVCVTQSCPTLCNCMDCSLPGSSVHGIFQARILEWVASSFSRGSSQSRDQTWVSCITGRCFTIWAMREVQLIKINLTSASYSHDTLYLQHDVMRRTLYLHHLSRN